MTQHQPEDISVVVETIAKHTSNPLLRKHVQSFGQRLDVILTANEQSAREEALALGSDMLTLYRLILELERGIKAVREVNQAQDVEIKELRLSINGLKEALGRIESYLAQLQQTIKPI